MAEGEWPTEWQPMIDAVGQDFGGGIVYVAADDVEKALVRRYLEPLEFDCPLHYDEEVAKQYGYRGIVAPYSGMSTWVADAKWKPGTVAFTSTERGALPPNAGLGRYPMPGDPEPPRLPRPATEYSFVTEMEVDYIRAVIVGDRLSQAGCKLLSCIPKETRVGRGAFFTTEVEIQNQRGELVARMRQQLYCYNPHPKAAE